MTLTNGQQPLYGCLNHQQTHGGLNTPGGTTDTIVIDFKNGVYTVNEAPVAVGDLTAEDLENWNIYDPADIVPGSGYPSLGQGPVFAGAALAAILDGATVVVDFDIDEDQFTFDIFEPTFTTFYQIEVETEGAGHGMRYLDTEFFVDSPVVPANGHHKLAFTQLFSTVALSLTGNALETTDSTDAAPPPTHVGFYLNGSGAGTFIRSVTIMPPQDNAELVGLSTL